MFLITLALAQQPLPAVQPDPPEHTPRGVDAVPWAQPFVLDEAAEWTMARDPSPLVGGWLLQVDAPAPLLMRRAIGQHVLYVDDRPVRPLHTPLAADCSVVVVPGDPEQPFRGRVYFGSTELPERVDAAHGAWELSVAEAAGIPVAQADEVAPAARYADLSALAAAAQARFDACRAAPLDSPPQRNDALY